MWLSIDDRRFISLNFVKEIEIRCFEVFSFTEQERNDGVKWIVEFWIDDILIKSWRFKDAEEAKKFAKSLRATIRGILQPFKITL